MTPATDRDDTVPIGKASPSGTADDAAVSEWSAELLALRERAQRAIGELAMIAERQAELQEKIRAHQERR
jgi:hypothetical protein